MARTRLVAVLFTDVVGSTAWRSRVGDAAADRMREPFDELMRSAVAAHEGSVVKSLGDGIMAVFDSATSAVEGAVAIQRAVDSEHRSLGSAGLEVRVGVSVGDVHLDEGDVHGMPVVEAARLCGAAAGGQILCRDTVRAVAGSRIDTGFVAIGELDLKGLPALLPAYEILWEPAGSPAPLQPSLVRDEQFAFIGRGREREQLLDAWHDTKAGARRTLLVSGEPGVGKTRLVTETARELHDGGALVLFGRCDEGLRVPYQPFAEALRHYLDHVDPPVLGRFGGDLNRLVPELHERVAGLDRPLQSDPDTERHRLHEAVALWLSAMSSVDPVTLVLDDLHWATKPTLELFRHVLVTAHALRVMVIATYRDSDVDGAHPMIEMLGDLLRSPGASPMALRGLDADDVKRFLTAASGHEVDEGGSELASAIHDTTGGNALFVSEVLRNLAETGAIVHQGGRWISRGPVDALTIPVGVREVVRRRLSRLGEAAREALAVGATIGAEFEARILTAAGGFDASAVEPALTAAVQARLIDEVPGPGIAFRFAHALVRASVYDDLSALRRAAIHRQVAGAIEEIGVSRAGRAADLAFHYSAAAADGDVAKAVEWSIRAGLDASERLAFSEGLTHFDRARTLRDGAGLPNDREACDLLIEIGHAQWALGDDRSRNTLLDAARLALRLGDTERQARALLADDRGMPATIGASDDTRIGAIERALESMGDDESIERARLTSELALALIYAPGTYSRRCFLAEEAVAMARRSSSPETLAATLHNYWLSIWAPGTTDERHRAYEELDRLGEEIDDPFWHALAQPRRIVHAVEGGDIDAAWRVSEAFDSMADDLGLPLVRWSAGFHRAALLEVRGELDQARQAADEALTDGMAAGQPDALLFHSGLTGMVQLWRDEYEVLVESLENVYQVFPDVPALPSFLALMLQRAGRTDDARTVVGDLLRAPGAIAPDGATLTVWTVLADFINLSGSVGDAPALLDVLRPNLSTIVGNGVNWNESVAVRVGQLEALLGNWDDAEHAFDTADAIARRMHAPLWQAIAAAERAWMHVRRGAAGDRDRALGLLDTCAELAEPRGAHLLRHRCSLVLADLD